jgi:four helix bundle protein
MSIGAQIVEGRGKTSEAEFARYLRGSVNSATKLEYHLMCARDFDAISKTHYEKLTAQTIEVRKMLYGLLDRINARKSENLNNRAKKSRPPGESLS